MKKGKGKQKLMKSPIFKLGILVSLFVAVNVCELLAQIKQLRHLGLLFSMLLHLPGQLREDTNIHVQRL